MLTVRIPNNYIEERKYILSVFLNEFLGISYSIEVKSELSNWELYFDNSTVIIEDHFFTKYSEKESYLDQDHIPKKINCLENELTPDENLPIIYGVPKVELNGTTVLCGIDIFASSFFMLTRWEEYVNKSKDHHNRFPGKESLAAKQGFIHRPVVNEYIEFLWNIMQKAGYKGERKEHIFRVIPTHDVDFIKKWPSFGKFLKTIFGDVFRRLNFKLLFKNKVSYLKGNDPYDTFDLLMDLSEKHGLKSHFFFMSGGNSIYDNNYSINSAEAKELISKIVKRGHHIGIHPSFNTYKDSDRLKEEKDVIEVISKAEVNSGRHHFLRFSVPETWQIWENIGMKWDSSMNYTHEPGFRSGVCYEYSVFNILTKRHLSLKEKPLVFMEIPYLLNKRRPHSEIFDLLDKVKKYKGEFVMLWHNSNIDHCNRKLFDQIYEKLLSTHNP